MDSDHGGGAPKRTMTADRDALVARVTALLTGTPRRSVVLRGPAGIGKSHVAERVLDVLGDALVGCRASSRVRG